MVVKPAQGNGGGERQPFTTGEDFRKKTATGAGTDPEKKKKKKKKPKTPAPESASDQLEELHLGDETEN